MGLRGRIGEVVGRRLEAYLIAKLPWAPQYAAFLDRAVQVWRTYDVRLAESILEQGGQLLPAIPDGTAQYATLRSMLGMALLVGHETTPDSGALNEAITLLDEAYDMTNRYRRSPAMAEERYLVHYVLAECLIARFLMRLEVKDFFAAQALTMPRDKILGRGELRCAPLAQHFDIALLNLNYFNATAELDHAVALGRSLMPELRDDWDWYRAASAFSSVLIEKAERTSDDELLAEAVVLAQSACEAAPDGLPTAWCLSVLSTALLSRHLGTRDLELLTEAIEAARRALGLTPEGNLGRAGSQLLLAKCLIVGASAEALPTAEELVREAASLISEALRQAPSYAEDRVAAGWMLGRVTGDDGPWDVSLRTYEAALGHLERLSGDCASVRSIEGAIRRYPGLVCEAAVTAMQCGREGLAYDWLERGRGLIIGQYLARRVDLAALGFPDRELLEETGTVTAEIEALGAGTDAIGDFLRNPPAMKPLSFREIVRTLVVDGGDSLVESRFARKVLTAWDVNHDDRLTRLKTRRQELVERIRDTPGFAWYGGIPSLDEAKAASEAGPIIVPVAGANMGYALVLSGGTIGSVPLPALSEIAVTRQVAELVKISELMTADPPAFGLNRRLDAILSWLWSDLALPVLDHLGLLRGHSGSGLWQRVWWIPTGQLSLMPVHAAHGAPADEDGPSSVLDCVVSSYAPTLRALMETRRFVSHPFGPQGLAVGLSTTPTAHRRPELPPLPSADTAARAVARLLHLESPALTDDGATRESVLASLGTAKFAHFFCHATASLDEPLDAELALYDGPLKAREIARMRGNAELAFLSGCGTGRGGTHLADEALNICSSFQAAGFRHVIGTLWPVTISTAWETSTAFYTHLGTTDAERSAEALHHSIRDRRAAGHRSLDWASHVHFGP
ncbi:CHAT domain-containing protein [Streptomyces sp. NPDC023998]|uniref:CHAT domain-containing protein n=1 Tax=Streptomyces sp. NPDC023998 TaxID=3154597 RepID=UPI0034034CA6